MRLVVVAATAVAMSSAVPVLAQSTSISASLIGNIVRTDSYDTGSLASQILSRDGESLGVALRVTQALNERWGLELEFAIPAEIENESPGRIPLFSEVTIVPPTAPSLFPSPTLPSFLAPPILNYRISTRQQHMTIGTTAWFRQRLGDRIALVYSAGVGMLRLRQDVEYSFGQLPPELPIPIPVNESTFVNYAVAPLLGLDARFELSSHLEIVTGIRVQPHSSLWQIRPGIGVAWTF